MKIKNRVIMATMVATYEIEHNGSDIIYSEQLDSRGAVINHES